MDSTYTIAPLISYVIRFTHKDSFSWYGEDCKEDSERLTPDCERANVTRIHALRQWDQEVLVNVATSNSKPSVLLSTTTV